MSRWNSLAVAAPWSSRWDLRSNWRLRVRGKRVGTRTTTLDRWTRGDSGLGAILTSGVSSSITERLAPPEARVVRERVLQLPAYFRIRLLEHPHDRVH